MLGKNNSEDPGGFQHLGLAIKMLQDLQCVGSKCCLVALLDFYLL